MMCPTIDNPASCEIRFVVRFLRAKNMSAAEIHRELSTNIEKRSSSTTNTDYIKNKKHCPDLQGRQSTQSSVDRRGTKTGA
jgi:hypothetical protein